MAKINNAFCKLLLPKEANKCRRQGKPSFCVKALHTQTSAIMNRRVVSFASVCVYVVRVRIRGEGLICHKILIVCFLSQKGMCFRLSFGGRST